MSPIRTYGTGERVILSVEDDPGAFSLLELGFDEIGGDFRLYHLNNGEEALDFLRHAGPYLNAPTPDLILLNFNMPRVSGLDVLQAMRDDPTIGDIPTVVFTSSRLNRDRANCLALGAQAFVSKPNNLKEFLDVLREVCSLV